MIATFIGGFSLVTNAQLGIQAGYVNSVFKTEIGNVKSTSDAYNGFNAGITYDYNINEYFGLTTGLLYSLITNKEKTGGAEFTSTGHYATLPINIKGNYPINRSGSLRIFAFVGPDFILGIAGKSKSSIANVESSSKWYDDDHTKRFDIALGMGAGLQYNNIRLKFGYDLGLLNLSDLDNVTYKRNHFNISLGYLF